MQPNQETFRSYASVLEKTQSRDKDARTSAEQAIKQMMSTPGFGIVALRFLTVDEVNPHLKQSSAVFFKNLVKDHWGSVSDPDKTQIKSIILPFLLSGPPAKLRALLSESVTLLAQHEFPQYWPNLVGDLVSRANTQDYNILVGILRTSHSVFRRYRNVSMSTDVLKELKFILEQFQRPLLAIYMQTWNLLGGPLGKDSAKAPTLIEALNLCTKIFYDLSYVDLPEFFEDHMKEFMTGFLQSIKFKTQLSSLTNGDDDKPGVIHKLQKNVCMVLTLFSTKYDEEFSQFLEGFVQGAWTLLTECLSSNSPKYESIVAHGVAFLTGVANGAHHRLFANGDIMKSICEKIVIPCMMLRDDDVELFEDDPMEYVRQDIEGSDLDTRRRSAKELVKGLRKNYEKHVTEIFGSYIQILLKQHASNPKQNFKAKDVAVFLLTAVAVSTFRQATGANSVNPMVPLIPFYKESILPDLNTQNVHPVLQADALKFVITFRSQIPASEYGRLIPAVVNMLNSPIWVVHTYAANAIDHMLVIKDKNAQGNGYTHRITKENLEPMLKNLLESLFGVFKKNGQKPNSYVIRAVMRVISKAKEKISSVVPMVLENLSSLLRTIILNPQVPVFNHFLFESIGALIGCAASAGGPGAVVQLENSILPMFQSILKQDIQEFTGYVFQLLGQLCQEQKEISDVYWNMFPSLLAPNLWDRPGNVPALVRLLTQFFQKGGQKIASNEQWMMSCLGVWQHLNSTTKHDGETFELLGAITDCMPLSVLDKFLPRILSFVFTRLSAAKGKTPRYIKGFVTFLLQFAAKHGGSAIITRCNAVQDKIWVNCLNLIGQSLNKPRSVADKKRCALGSIKLLTDTNEMMVEPHRALWGPLLGSLMALFELPEEDENDNVINDEEITGGAVFTPLYHAGMLTEKDPYPGVNEKTELAKGLSNLNKKTNGQVKQMIQSAIPPEALQKLQTYFAHANITL